LRTALSVSALSLLTACATGLAHRTPIDIASNSVRRVDSKSGVNEILAPSVKAFSARRGGVSGKAQLRTAGLFTDDKGIVQRGGAYLDVLVNYATATPNPEEARLYNQVRWAGGEPALLAEFGGSVLDCREDYREIRSYPSTSYGLYGVYGTGYGHGRHKHKKDHHGDHGNNHGDHDNDHSNDGDHADHDNGNNNGQDSANHPAPGRPDRPRRPRRPHDDVAPQPDGPGTEPTIPRVNRPVVYRPNPAPRTAQPRPVQISKPAPKSRPVSKHKPAVNRSFGRTNNSRTKAKHTLKRHLDYDQTQPYYDRGSTGYVVSRRCDRQESLRVFIPRERLDAAAHSGLRLYFRPKAGREEVLVLPANYISGFKLAAYSPEGKHLTIPGNPARLSDKPQRPDPQKPIIYGQK